MFELFYAGGAFYMGVLTLVFIAMIAVAVINGLAVFKEENEQIEVLVRRLSYIKSVGLFALIVGILFQLMGLVGAFQAIEQVGSVSPAMLAGGLKVSIITTIYGLIIYVISYLIWMGLSFKLKK
jgi:biopolymer transport protein ExbB/TolQ